MARSVAKRQADSGEADQGIREILALVTAGQAFKICSGVVTASQSEKAANTAETISEGKQNIELKDAVNRLVGLSIGGLAGAGAAVASGAGAGAAAAIAAGIGLVGAATANYSTKRTRNLQQDNNYQFILDRSGQF